jgi:hypothetical protein
MPQRLTESKEDYDRRSAIEANEAILRLERASMASRAGKVLHDGYATPRDAYEARVEVEERTDAWIIFRFVLLLCFWWIWLPMWLIRRSSRR